MNATQLRSIPVFSGLSKSQLQRVAECAEEITVAQGERLLHEGRFAFEFFAIAAGEVEVVRNGAHVADLGPGDVMGELGALTHGQRTASVVAKVPTTVVYLRAQDFRHFTDEMPELGAQIRRVVDERTRSIGSAAG